MKESVKRYIPLDQHYRMRAEGLEEAIRKDKNEGFNPWLIVATGGTTDTGAVDPLDSIADIAILVIDIKQGIQPQTIESIKILKQHKMQESTI